MKQQALRSNAPILQKAAKRSIVQHPAKLSNILGSINYKCYIDVVAKVEIAT